MKRFTMTSAYGLYDYFKSSGVKVRRVANNRISVTVSENKVFWELLFKFY